MKCVPNCAGQGRRDKDLVQGRAGQGKGNKGPMQGRAGARRIWYRARQVQQRSGAGQGRSEKNLVQGRIEATSISAGQGRSDNDVMRNAAVTMLRYDN